MCLRTLLRAYPSQARIVDPVVRAATGDEDAEVRLEAATALGAEGTPTLAALVADASLEDTLSARAVEALGKEMPADLARATLRQELAASVGQHRLATACACASALGRRGEAQDEELLLRALPKGPDETLRLAAARALGAAGSARAVPSLAELSRSDSASLQRAGRLAIQAIQSRLQGATPGQLSLGTADSGQVSLADDVAGRLSDPGRSDR
jgi:HEAT repeat protein